MFEKTSINRFLLLVALLGCVSCRSGPPAVSDSDAYCYPEQILTLVQMKQEVQTKIARIAGVLHREGLSGALLQKPPGVAWVTAGTISDEVFPGDQGSAAVFIGDDSNAYLMYHGDLSPESKKNLLATGFEVRETAWDCVTSFQESIGAFIAAKTGGRPFWADTSSAAERDLANRFEDLQWTLTETEIQKYRWLGSRCAKVVESACRRIEPGMTERGIEGMVAADLLRYSIRPLVLQAAADGQVIGGDPRYPVGTRKVEKHVAIRLAAARWGLSMALNRTVHFGPLPEGMRNRMIALARLTAGFWARTTPGERISEILKGALADYAAVGDREGWRNGPQGGAIGYHPVERHAAADQRLLANQAFSWSPVLADLRSEDTVLLIDENFEVITATGDWPMMESEVLGRIYRIPGILVR